MTVKKTPSSTHSKKQESEKGSQPTSDSTQKVSADLLSILGTAHSPTPTSGPGSS